MTENIVEWCVMHPNYPHEPHRGPMSEADARSWVAEVEADGAKVGAFYVASREVGPWKRLTEDQPSDTVTPMTNPENTSKVSDWMIADLIDDGILRQVGWLGPYGIVPGGLDNEPAPQWRPVYAGPRTVAEMEALDD
jgi:hypothetical protein